MNPKRKKTRGKKYTICVSGGAEGKNAEKAKALGHQVGRLIAQKGCVLITGATTGVPFEAAKGAKEAGGSIIGFSPAGSEEEHVRKYRLPADKDIFDHIIYAEAGYTGRNLLMIRSSDGTIVIDGRIGTLNEFTSAFEENEVVGVLQGSGGIADEIERLLTIAGKGVRKTIFDHDPEKLVEKVIARIKKEKKK